MSETAPNQPNQIIDSVPLEINKPPVQEGVVYSGQVISIPESEFKGDPRRVPGHPLNPATDINFAEALPKQTTTEAPTPNSDLITEVPKFDQSPTQEQVQAQEQPTVNDNVK